MSVNSKDFDGMTSLHYAAGRGHCHVITWLLDNGATAMSDFIGGTALHSAAQMGEIEVRACEVEVMVCGIHVDYVSPVVCYCVRTGRPTRLSIGRLASCC